MIVAIDQSYARCGLAICVDGTVTQCQSMKMLPDKKAARRELRRAVKRMVDAYQPEFIIVERVRQFSQGQINMASITALASLVTTIVDASSVPVKSVETRSWKARVLGNAKATKDDAVAYARTHGFEVDDDAADALAMSLYPFQPNPLLRDEH